MSAIIETQIAIAGSRLPVDVVDRVREALQRDPWGLWCTLYVDSSNAGSQTLPSDPRRQWAWGARGRATDSVVDILETRSTFERSGLTPEAIGADSGVAELWGIVHAVRATIEVWPWLAGIGVRCDNLEAVTAVAGCDGRRPLNQQSCRRKLRPACEALAEVVRPHRIHLRATHVHGHGRADTSAKQAYNRGADSLARRAARTANRGEQ